MLERLQVEAQLLPGFKVSWR